MEETLQELKILVAKGQTENAIHRAIDLFQNDKLILDELYLLSNQLSTINKETSLGLVDDKKEVNRINYAFLNLISNPKEKTISSKSKINLSKLFLLAFLIITLVGLGWYFLSDSNKITPEQLVGKYRNISAPLFEANRAGYSEINASFTDASRAFLSGQYDESIIHFEKLKEENNNPLIANLGIAFCNLYLSKFELSKLGFKEYLTENKKSIGYKNIAELGLVLSKIGLNEIDDDLKSLLNKMKMDKINPVGDIILEIEKDLKHLD